MSDVSIMSMIAGFLPASSDPPPPHSPTATSAKPSAAAAGLSSTAGHGGAATRRREVHMICFSKDRAFQLDQLLESSKRHLRLGRERGREGEALAQLSVSVLYVASAPSSHPPPETADEAAASQEVAAAAGFATAPALSGSGRTMEESYDIVRRRHPSVRFVRERPGEFCDQLCSLVREETGDPAPGSTGDGHKGGEERFVLFAVDDMFFYRDFELPGALELLSTDPSTFCVHLRLHPGITWSHTSGAPCHVPPLSPSARQVTLSQGTFTGRHGSGREDVNDERQHAGEEADGASENDEVRERRRHAILAAEFGLLTFSREEAMGEWDYPWDLTGGLYRREDTVAVVDGIVSAFGKHAAANPNLLEYHGHVLLQRTEKACGTGAASVADAALSTAVNVAKAAPRCGCSGRAVVSSIAVNRVQSTYSTPVYASRGGGIGDLDGRLRPRRRPLSPTTPPREGTSAVGCPAADGLAEGEEGRTEGGQTDCEAGHGASGEGRGGGLDGRAFRRRVFNSVHVGELWFEGDGATEGNAGDAAEGMTARRDSHAETGGTNNWRGGDNEPQHSHADTLTVLLPVRNGGDRLIDAVESVLFCAGEMPSGWGVDLLIVDDGSEDGAVERAVAAVPLADPNVPAVGDRRDLDAGRDQTGVGVGPGERGTSARGAGPGKEGCLGTEQTMVVRFGSAARGASAGGCDVFASGRVVPDGISGRFCPERGRSESAVAIRVLRHERSVGLAESLNEGLREARGDLVARMDADDVCMPGRLTQQVAFMLEHPHVSVLGTSVATFSGRTIRGSGDDSRIKEPQSPQPPRRGTTPEAVRLPMAGVQRIARHPTDPGFLAWSMLFSCCLAHPSAMLRRDRVMEVGGYDPTTEPAEDYDLWLRMQSSAPGCVANMGEVLLGLRKHDQNVSSQRRVEQVLAADAAAARTMTRLLTRQRSRRVVTPAQAAAVRRPETAVSAGDLADAARLLGDLGAAAALATEKVEPCKAANTGTEASSLKVVAPSPGDDESCNAAGDLPQSGGDEHPCEQQRRGRDMVARDIEARLGAMGVQAMSRFGGGASPVLDEWRKRFPDKPLLLPLRGEH